MPYFHISTGLRGCYMPDSAYVAKCFTRRELRALIDYEAGTWRDAGAHGASQKAVSALAAAAWREAKKARPATLPHCLPIKPEGAGSYSSGIFASVATRADYLEQERDQ